MWMHNIKRDQKFDQRLDEGRGLSPNAPNDKPERSASSFHDPRIVGINGTGSGDHGPNVLDGQGGRGMRLPGFQFEGHVPEHGGQAVQIQDGI